MMFYVICACLFTYANEIKLMQLNKYTITEIM